MRQNGKQRVVGIVQARMGASRLPNKMLLHLNGYPLVEWIFRRISKSRLLDELLFAIPDSPDDDVLALHLEKVGANVFRGSEDNVLERFYLAAKTHAASHVVRICADNPLICPVETDRLIKFCLEEATYDFAYNNVPINNLYPDGFGAEMVTFATLSKIYRDACTPEQREHVLKYIWDHPRQFKISTFDPPDVRLQHPETRLDVDTMDDYRRMAASGVEIDMNALECLKLFVG